MVIQGTLSSVSGGALTGVRDYRVRFYESASMGPALEEFTGSVSLSTAGRFSIELAPSQVVLDATETWYELAVDSGGDGRIDPNDVFGSRVRIHSVPFALRAAESASLGGQPASAYITNVSLTASAWNLDGNTGTPGKFLGTTDDQPLEFRVNGKRVLRLGPPLGTPNIIGGHPDNRVDPGSHGATISGGGEGGSANRVTQNFGAVGGGAGNVAGASFATVAGGNLNIADGFMAVVAGGGGNNASSNFATVGGGNGNAASNSDATVGGGNQNHAQGDRSTVGGGQLNRAVGRLSTIPGGWINTAIGNLSFAAGNRAQAAHDGAFVWADFTDADFTSTRVNQFAVRANGGVVFEGTPTSDVPMVTINSGTGFSGSDGLRINEAEDDGIQIGDDVANPNTFPKYGVYIPTPGVPNTALWVQTADAGGQWALNTDDKIQAQNVTAKSVSLVAKVEGPNPLEPGDLAAAVGFADPMPNQKTPLALVRLANEKTASGIIGVVESRRVLEPAKGKTVKGKEPLLELRSQEGPAQPGDYVGVTVLGVTYVKVDPKDGAVVAGQRLTASTSAGKARPLRSQKINGMSVTEGAPVIGIALASNEKDAETVPIFVSPR